MASNTTTAIDPADAGRRGLRHALGALSSRAARLPRLVAALIVLVVLLVHNSSHEPATFHFDSRLYWELGRSFLTDGGFARAHMTDIQRGYSLPLLNSGLIELAGVFGMTEPRFFGVASAIGYAALFTLAWPWMVRALFGYRMNSIEILAWAGLVYYFWRGHFLYPLSDFPALFLALAGVAGVRHFLAGGGRGWLLGAGVALALASNMRPSYQLALLLVAAALAITVVRAGRGALRSMGAFAVGVAIAYAPQSSINMHRFGTPSPFVQTELARGGPSLFLQQLAWGVYIQRYETNVQKGGPLPRGGVVFVDEAGLDIVRNENMMQPKGRQVAPLNPAFTYGDYVRLVFNHPLFFARAFARHLFNGLDIAYSTVYITDIREDNDGFRVVNYVVWLAALGAALLATRRECARRPWAGIALFAAVCVPSLLSAAGAVETRFFLPLFFGAYLLVVVSAVPLLTWLHDARHYVKGLVLVAVVAGVLAARALSHSTFASLPI